MAHHHRELSRANHMIYPVLALADAFFSQTQAIDDAYRSVGACDDADKREEGKKIVAEIAELKYEVQHDRALTCVPFVQPDNKTAAGMLRNDETGRSETMDTPTWPATTRSSSSWATSPG